MREPVEFYCNDCLGGGYFVVNLNMNLEGSFVVVCPKCGREHPRTIRNSEMIMTSSDFEVKFLKGKAKIDIRHDGGAAGGRERIVPPMSSWSKQSRIELMNKVRSGYMQEAWMRRAAEERGEIDAHEAIEEHEEHKGVIGRIVGGVASVFKGKKQ